MVDYNPPTGNLPIFDKLVFVQSDTAITQSQADKRYLRYPNAQGTENLAATNINGVLNANSTTNLNSSVSIPNNDIFVRNIRIGHGTGTISRNTVMGGNSGIANTTGDDNVFVGYSSGNQNTTGSSNVIVGSFTGRFVTQGAQNTFLGRDAGTGTTVGIRNTFIGRQAGYYNTGSNNVGIGGDADAVGNLSNTVTIGCDVKATASNTIVIGLSSQSLELPCTIGTSINYGSLLVSAKRQLNNVSTLSFIDNLSGALPTGTAISSIYTDSTLVSSLSGMYYDCGINSGYHQFSVKDSGGTITTPVYYGSALTSISNTLVVRNATTTSNRLDISVDNAQNTTIRARSATSSTSAIIYLSADTVSALGVVTTSTVVALTPLYMEIRRPILFNYTTFPAGATNLGYLTSATIAPISYASSGVIQSLGSLALGIGTWAIDCSFTFQASGNHTYSVFSYAINTANNAFPTIMPYLVSYMRDPDLNINTNTISRQISMTLQLTAATTIYFPFWLVFGGGGNTIIGLNYTYTRIG